MQTKYAIVILCRCLLCPTSSVILSYFHNVISTSLNKYFTYFVPLTVLPPRETEQPRCLENYNKLNFMKFMNNMYVYTQFVYKFNNYSSNKAKSLATNHLAS